MRVRFALLPAALLVALTALPPPATAETLTCTEITSLPTTISTQGVYCMKKNFSMNLGSGAAITVTVNNVTIDCNDFKIGNLPAGTATQAVGVSAASRLNVRVRGCGIRGFRRGVSLDDGLYQLEDNRFDNNYEVGAAVSGDGSLVRGNEVVDTGGSTAVGAVDAYGLLVGGDMDIADNVVTGVAAAAGSGGDAYGIASVGNDAGTISGNRIRSLAPDGAGRRRGIWSPDGHRLTVERNTVVMNGGNLLSGEAGIRCGDIVLDGASRDNTVLGVGLLGGPFALLNCQTAVSDYTSAL